MAGNFSGSENLHRVVRRWLDGARNVWRLAFGGVMPPVQQTRNSLTYKLKTNVKDPARAIDDVEQRELLDVLPTEIEAPTSVVFAAILSRVLPTKVGKKLSDVTRRAAGIWMRKFLDACCIEAEVPIVQIRCPGAWITEHRGTPYSKLGTDGRVEGFAELLQVLVGDEWWGPIVAKLHSSWADELARNHRERLVDHDLQYATIGELAVYWCYYANEQPEWTLSAVQLVKPPLLHRNKTPP
jgi:hypothetical protein